MKKETYANKLAALLGLEEKLEEVKKKEEVRRGNTQAISEEEIQSFREAQGITYFLQAPALFQLKVCKHCGADFLVSRLYVAFCSYTCIRKSLNEIGIEWRKGDDIEALVASVYEGNEPIWIRNLPALREALTVLTESTSSDQKKSLPVVSTSSEKTPSSLTASTI